jgi:hypothetical protein
MYSCNLCGKDEKIVKIGRRNGNIKTDVAFGGKVKRTREPRLPSKK